MRGEAPRHSRIELEAPLVVRDSTAPPPALPEAGRAPA
jgi:hypothetical protein